MLNKNILHRFNFLKPTLSESYKLLINNYNLPKLPKNYLNKNKFIYKCFKNIYNLLFINSSLDPTISPTYDYIIIKNKNILNDYNNKTLIFYKKDNIFKFIGLYQQINYNQNQITYIEVSPDFDINNTPEGDDINNNIKIRESVNKYIKMIDSNNINTNKLIVKKGENRYARITI